MPNWCKNELTIVPDKHDNENDIIQYKEAIDIITDDKKTHVVFDKLIPVPLILKDLTYINDEPRIIIRPTKTGHPIEKRPLTSDEIIELKNSKHKKEYDFCMENWGVRANPLHEEAGITEENNRCFAVFYTAWAPPIPFVEKLRETYPGIHVHMFYREDGLQFAGYA